MKPMGEFLKSTIVGGLLVVVPIYFSVLLLAKALAGLVELLAPITAMLPDALQGLRGPVAAVLATPAAGALYILTRDRIHWVDARSPRQSR